MEKLCNVCGKKIEAQSRQQKYCSDECRRIGTRRVKAEYERSRYSHVCPVCGKTFAGTARQVYCSYECKNTEKKCVCKTCGKEFFTKSLIQKYCSPACRKKPAPNHQPQEKCAHCGKGFTPHAYNQKYCSVSCRYNARLSRYKKSRDDDARLLEKTCPVCGKKFKTHFTRQRYCSEKCCDKSRRPPLHERTCPLCGKTFMPRRKSHIYCSDKCRNNSSRIKEKKPEISKIASMMTTRKTTPKSECLFCGELFVPRFDDEKFCCEECRELSTKGLKEAYASWFHSKKIVQKESERREPNKKSLTQWQKEAADCGLSYGYYRSQIEKLGKSFEQLRIEYLEKKLADKENYFSRGG